MAACSEWQFGRVREKIRSEDPERLWAGPACRLDHIAAPYCTMPLNFPNPSRSPSTHFAEESAGYLRARGLSENVEPPTASEVCSLGIFRDVSRVGRMGFQGWGLDG